MFLERIHIFSNTNPYYKEGGEFNIYGGDVRMPNCTTYAYLRMQEMCELKKRDNFFIRDTGGFGNAKTWYDTTPLHKGTELKEGSVLVWDGNYGHVAVLEVIDGNKIVITQSQYDANKDLRNYKYWERKEIELVDGVPHLDGVGDFIGCIYPPINDIRKKRDTSKEQIEILDYCVNVRTCANGVLTNAGCYAPKGIYNVLEKETVDEYTWFKLEENHWVREGEWLKFYPVDEEDYRTLYFQELEKNKELETKIEKIKEIVV